MTCEQLAALYEEYALGVLEGEERAEMEAHLARPCDYVHRRAWPKRDGWSRSCRMPLRSRASGGAAREDHERREADGERNVRRHSDRSEVCARAKPKPSRNARRFRRGPGRRPPRWR